MAALPKRIQLLRAATAGNTPTLLDGELGVDYLDTPYHLWVGTNGSGPGIIDLLSPYALIVDTLALSGGLMTGPITLSGDATAALNPVSLQQMTGAINGLSTVYAPLVNPTGGQNNYLPVNNATVTGTFTLAADAATNLQAVPLQQLNSVISGLSTVYAPLTNPAGGQNNYLPVNNPTFTGNLSGPNVRITDDVGPTPFYRLYTVPWAGGNGLFFQYVPNGSTSFVIGPNASVLNSGTFWIGTTNGWRIDALGNSPLSISSFHGGGPTLTLNWATGATFAVPVILPADATQPLQAVPLQQLTAGWLPINNPVFTGTLTGITPGAAVFNGQLNAQGNPSAIYALGTIGCFMPSDSTLLYMRAGVPITNAGGLETWPGFRIVTGNTPTTVYSELLLGSWVVTHRYEQDLSANPIRDELLFTNQTGNVTPVRLDSLNNAVSVSVPLLLAADATQPLEAVPLQQLQAGWLPINNPTFTGTLTGPSGFSVYSEPSLGPAPVMTVGALIATARTITGRLVITGAPGSDWDILDNSNYELVINNTASGEITLTNDAFGNLSILQLTLADPQAKAWSTKNVNGTLWYDAPAGQLKFYHNGWHTVTMT